MNRLVMKMKKSTKRTRRKKMIMMMKKKKNSNLHLEKKQLVNPMNHTSQQVNQLSIWKKIILITQQSCFSFYFQENNNRLVTRNQQKPSPTNNLISTNDQTKKKSNVPVGFPTSKINIPSFQPSRVGLSRRSGAIKPLHPNLNQRGLHE